MMMIIIFIIIISIPHAHHHMTIDFSRFSFCFSPNLIQFSTIYFQFVSSQNVYRRTPNSSTSFNSFYFINSSKLEEKVIKLFQFLFVDLRFAWVQPHCRCLSGCRPAFHCDGCTLGPGRCQGCSTVAERRICSTPAVKSSILNRL